MRAARVAGCLFVAMAAAVVMPPAHAATPVASAVPAPPGAPPGMQRYTLGILYRGAAWVNGHSPRVDSLQKAHLANIKRMFELGKLVGAGPFVDDAHVIGLFIFSADSSEAAALVRSDPEITTQRFAITLLPWWAPAGIGDAYRAGHRGEAADAAPMEQLQFAFLLRGPKWQPVETVETAKLQQAHLDHLKSLAASGELVAAGPFDGDSDLRGALIFRCDQAVAQHLAGDDPKVKSGWLEVDFHPWMVARGVIPAAKKK